MYFQQSYASKSIKIFEFDLERNSMIPTGKMLTVVNRICETENYINKFTCGKFQKSIQVNNPNNSALTKRIKEKRTEVGLLNAFHATDLCPLPPPKIETPCFEGV